MRKLLFFSMAALMVLAAVSCSKTQEEVDLCGQMDDAVFKAYCLENFDADGDGRILQAEADEVTEIVVPSMGIASLQGIGAFVNLEKLDCSDNLLTSLDLRKNPKLIYLDCRDNLIDVIYLNDGQEIEEFYKTPFLHTPPLLLTVNGQAAVVVEQSKPLTFEATFTGKNLPENLTWESNLPSFQPVTSEVNGSTVSLSFTKATEIGELEPGKLYRMYATAPDGTRSNYVRFGIFGKGPIMYFQRPRQYIDALLEEQITFFVFFYPGEGQSGTPSIKVVGEGCNRTFASGFKEREDESLYWREPGEKKVIVYYERYGQVAKDTLYVNVTEGLPEITNLQR